jgi:hypothetical protein
MASLAVEGKPCAISLRSLPPIVQCLVSDYVGDFLYVYRNFIYVCKEMWKDWTGSMQSIEITKVRSERVLKSLLEDVVPKFAKNMKTLVLNDVSLSAKQLGHLEDSDVLARLLRLRISNIKNELNFWNCGFTGNLSLMTLEIDHAPVTYVASLVTHCRSLTSLSLSQVPDFGDSDLSSLASVLPSLQHIKLARVALTNVGVSYLLKNHMDSNPDSPLESLELSSKRIDGDVFKILKDCESLNLSKLNVSGCTLNSGDALRSFVETKGFALLSLGIGCHIVDDQWLAQGLCMPRVVGGVNPLPQLSIVNLTGASVSGRGIRLLAECYGPQLKELFLGWCTQVDGDGIEALGNHALGLTVLVLDKCRRIRIHDIIPVLENCSRLKRLSCKDTSITRSIFEKEAKKRSVHGSILFIS